MPETTLSLILTISVKTCRLVEARRKILRFVETRRHIFGRARISTKNAGPEHFGSNLVIFLPKIDKILATFHQFGMVFFQGACFCWKKTKWLVSEARGLVRFLVVFFGARTCQNMVLGLIRTLMAPNLDPRPSPGIFLRCGSPGRHQIQPSCQKWLQIFRDLGRDFSGNPRFFRPIS